MEYFLIVSFRKLRSDSNSESKKPKQITAAKFEEISQQAKLVKLTPISSVSMSVPVVNSSSGLLSKDMVLLGNKKELSCVTHVLGETGHPDGPLTEQLIDLEALAKQPGFPQEALCEPFAWVSWRHNLCYLSMKNILIFRREILGNKVQSQFTVLSGGTSSDFCLQGTPNDMYSPFLGSGATVTAKGILGYISASRELAFINLRSVNSGLKQAHKKVAIPTRGSSYLLLKYSAPQWCVASSEDHEVFVISSKTCKIMRKVKLQMKHADDQEKIFACAPSGSDSFIALSHWGGGNNSLHVSSFDSHTGKLVDVIPMNTHAGGFGLLQSFVVSQKSGQTLCIAGMGRGQIHLLSCYKGKLKVVQSVEFEQGGASLFATVGQLQVYKGQEYYIAGDTKKTNIFKLTY